MAVIAQIDLEKLFAISKPEIKFVQLPKYPQLRLIFYMVMDEETGAGDMMLVMKETHGANGFRKNPSCYRRVQRKP